VENRLLASILFTAAFDVLDRMEDAGQKKALARRVHAGAYERMEGHAEGKFSAGNEGRVGEPSPGAGVKSPGPRPPRSARANSRFCTLPGNGNGWSGRLAAT
jgi:hypothetical protein